MQDIHTVLANLHRPRLLMRAARIGAESYRRAGHLPRILGYGVLPRHGDALMRLIDIEAELEELRLGPNATYSISRHVDVLIAIVAEARELRASQTSPQLH